MNSIRILPDFLPHPEVMTDFAYSGGYPLTASRFDESLPRQVSLRHFLILLACVLALHGALFYAYTRFGHESALAPLKNEVEVEFVKPQPDKIMEPEPPRPPPPRVVRAEAPPSQLRTLPAEPQQSVPPEALTVPQNPEAPHTTGPVVAAPPAPVAPEPVTEPTANAAHLHNPPQRYPAMAVRQGWEGAVLLRVHVQASGKPDKVEIKQSSGHKVLDDEAILTVSNWTFVPAHRGNAPIDGWVTQPIEFKLTK